MDLMDVFERQALAGKELVDGWKPEGKEPARSGKGIRRCHQPAQILELDGLAGPRLYGRTVGRRGKKHKNIYRTIKEQRQYEWARNGLFSNVLESIAFYS